MVGGQEDAAGQELIVRSLRRMAIGLEQLQRTVAGIDGELIEQPQLSSEIHRIVSRIQAQVGSASRLLLELQADTGRVLGLLLAKEYLHCTRNNSSDSQ
jgi:hypothetical protein